MAEDEKKNNKKNMGVIFGLMIALALLIIQPLTNIAVLDPEHIVKVNITEPREKNGGLPVNIQDQVTRPLDLFFIKTVDNFPRLLANNTIIDDTAIQINTAFDNCSAGDYIGIFNGTFYFAEVLSIAGGTTLNLDTPIDNNFTINDPVICVTREMNVDGSITPEIFRVSGPTAQNFSVDITRILIQMTCTDIPDFTDFCHIGGGLTNGVVLRRVNSVTENIFNAKSNAELANLMYDLIDLQQNKQFNTNGVIGRFTFAGQDKHGVAVRLAPGESLELWIQDDLTSLLSFRIIAEGHIVTD